ncbi:glycosyltransferase family 4 protein [Micromonospora sp. NBC_01655]|uniref:glycosyltransferase family 4 protein n=1 Tax=Micromonospora sp. NBC_01655 TaxID=2975983 RepID=UPI002257A312|nr:glycosyltransferase family 4 protein [Micromonospora sp. NBC_01655]MCX4474091.1 glycosyltransferase family 4 protein [Micromonospora sp. NBC_01655]
MRIAMVHSGFAVRGGAERYVRDLSRALADRGHEVRVYSRTPDGEHPEDRPVGERLSARLTRLAPRLAKLFTHLGDLVDPTGLGPDDLRDFDPDVVHLHNWQGLGVRPVARLSRRWPTCHSVHDHAVRDPNNALGNLGRSAALDALLRLRSRWVLRQLGRCTLLFPSERTRQRVLAGAPGARPATRLLPLAVPLPPGPRDRPPGDRRVFLYLGALDRHKGVDLLLDAWADAVDAVGGTLLVGGDGPLRAEVERAAERSRSVRYLGYLDAEGKRAAFLRAGWLVFPSQCAETFGLVCAEALTAARPIIASDTARPPMAEETSVLVFRTRDELAELLRRAARTPDDEYAAMSASAGADGARLDWDRHVDAVVETYRTVGVRAGADQRPEVSRQ